MARNIEIKAHVPDLAAVRQKASALASAPPQRMTQRDTFLIVPTESVYSIVRCADAQTLLEALAHALPVRGRIVKRREVFLSIFLNGRRSECPS